MTLKLLSFFFFLLSFILHSQNNNIEDKLFSAIFEKSKKNHSNDDFKKASIFFIQKNWDSTLIFTQKTLKKSPKEKSIKNLSFFYRGVSLFRQQVYHEAENQFGLISNDFEFINKVQVYLGAINLKLKKYEKAISYYQKLTKLPNKESLYLNEAILFDDLALCYFFLGNYNEAESYFKKSNVYEKDTLNLIDSYINIANLYYQQYKDNIAIPYFKKAYNLSKKINVDKKKFSEKDRKIYYRKSVATKNMAVVEENQKNLKKALLYRKEYEKYIDTLNNRNRIYEVAQKEKEFAVATKQKEVDFLQVQNELKETQRNNFIYIASILLVLLLISGYFYREKVKTNHIIAAQKETLNELNATKDKLFSIVSHDLRSSVNALKSSNAVLVDNLQSKNLEALENLLQKNSSIVNGAYGLLDNLLNWALLQTDQGYFHIDTLRLFIIIEHVAYNYKPLLFEKELTFENSVSKKAMIAADQESLKIVLRNLLDNAIKFSKPHGALKVYVEESDDFWNLIVEDTGLGMSEETRLELLKDTALLNKKEHEDVLGTGLGLSLVKSMIRKNNGKFNIESELGKGTKMIVSLKKVSLSS
ncbi:ATP-binding protein [Tenacibaculum agarivorans]|uniref:ATP-binding protein n=1 Tax=Tenacibaculum agarivorans TaxID=1908389 RepID=UPI00094B8504|nr:ATP-binding protein [Tenacibaculum agarivorans]